MACFLFPNKLTRKWFVSNGYITSLILTKLFTYACFCSYDVLQHMTDSVKMSHNYGIIMLGFYIEEG